MLNVFALLSTLLMIFIFQIIKKVESSAKACNSYSYAARVYGTDIWRDMLRHHQGKQRPDASGTSGTRINNARRRLIEKLALVLKRTNDISIQCRIDCCQKKV